MPAPSGQGIVGCAPIPGYGAGPATPPPPRWVSRWGAIATDETTASLGSVTGESSKERAIQAALAHCKINGGTKCKLAIAYDNQCAAMTVGENSFNITNEATLDKAVDSVLAYCKATDTNCRVYHTTCSFPEQIP
ncbi:DUF4189 domain-containing protein [Luteibacter rhizovicinus]|uniref:DUF4189 domain-containing protein n=1 Tax=Luteibacter rhizovicinus TaxID=242606 RepID=UPI003D18AD5C